MTGAWFFARPEDWTSSRIVLPADESHHAARVLRIEPGDLVTVIDGRGTIARAAIDRAVAGRLELEVIEKTTQRRPVPELVLYQGVAKGLKLDEVVGRAAELGVAAFYAYEGERSVAHWDEAKVDKLQRRWHSIARAAAKVARSGHVMTATGGLSLNDVAARVADDALAVVLWEEATIPLRSALIAAVPSVALVVGPEGGLSAGEVARLTVAGASAVSLGPRILRTEAAGPAAVAAIAYHYGLLG